MNTEGRQPELNRVEEILSTLDDGDLDLHDPPESVWDAIASRLAPSARFVDASGTSATVVEYSIDRDDIVQRTGADWARFATDNGAPEMTMLDRSRTLWSYMNSDAVREPWQLLVQRVRETELSASVTFRCDAPDVRRWFELVLTPTADRSIHFRTTLLLEEPRDPITFLEHAIERDADAEPIELCAWCGRGRSGDDWLDIEALLAAERLLEQDPPPSLAHGICGACRAGMAADLLVGRSSTAR